MYSETSLPGKNKKYNGDFRFKQLQILEKTIDWDKLVEAIFPFYIKSNIEYLSLTVESMLRINILLRYFDMTPSELEKELHEVDTLRDFILIDNLTNNEIPSAALITEFSSILFEKDLVVKIEQELKTKYTKLQ